ncbi:MAG: zinc ABC transporter substrate-binding protein [Chlorobium sp.]|nr:zinc ABC transporter substrate-binding protein [Chlorobium phaeovibrioides]NQU46044.1 zinc ABC transporter substrate-binding protein [Chlorobium sp.]
MMKRVTIVLLLLLLAVIPSSCTSPSESGRMRVVVSIQPLAWFAERIAGDLAEVRVMVPPGGNPHTYEPLPRQMRMLAETAFFVKAGSGVEFEIDWMERFMTLNPSLTVYDAARGVALLPMAAGHGHQHGSSVFRYDPHYWLAPRNGMLIADTIAGAFSKEDPQNSALYRENARRLKEELEELDAFIRGRLQGLGNRSFLVFHPAWGYFAHAYGLHQIAAEEEGKSLTPRQMERVILQAREAGITVVFVSPQFSTAQAETIARGIGGVTRSVDPLAFSYDENLRAVTAAFLEGGR